MSMRTDNASTTGEPTPDAVRDRSTPRADLKPAGTGRGRRSTRSGPAGRRSRSTARRAALWTPLVAAVRWRAVINATGVLLHNDLGRAPMAVEERPARYTNLDFDVVTRHAQAGTDPSMPPGSWLSHVKRRMLWSSTTGRPPSSWFSLRWPPLER